MVSIDGFWITVLPTLRLMVLLLVISALVIDITELKRAEEALQARELKYRRLFENMDDGVSLHEIITDENGPAVDFRFLETNAAYERHTGFNSKEVIGKTMLDIFPRADKLQIENYGKVALTGEPLQFEYYSKTSERHSHVCA